jgi:hypothetical protein
MKHSLVCFYFCFFIDTSRCKIIVGRRNSFRTSQPLVKPQATESITVEEMLKGYDVNCLLEGAPQNSVRQTIDVERLEDEILTEQPTAISGDGISSTTVDSALDIDYDKVSEQASKLFYLSSPT